MRLRDLFLFCTLVSKGELKIINFNTGYGTFNFRVAGILIRDGRVLIHRLLKDDFYAFPGGRVELFEDTEKPIIREMKEELDVEISINRLLWVSEHFFTHENARFHEICFYYLIECNDEKLDDQKSDTFDITEGNNQFEFKWVSISDIYNTVLYPTFIKYRLTDLPNTIEKVIDIDTDE